MTSKERAEKYRRFITTLSPDMKESVLELLEMDFDLVEMQHEIKLRKQIAHEIKTELL